MTAQAHQINIVGGGVAGQELASTLGWRWRRQRQQMATSITPKRASSTADWPQLGHVMLYRNHQARLSGVWCSSLLWTD